MTGRKIDKKKMYSNLKEIVDTISEDIKSTVKDTDIELSVGQNPPRIYASFDYDRQFYELEWQEMGGAALMTHKDIVSKMSTDTNSVKEIMRKYGLKEFKIDPFFRSKKRGGKINEHEFDKAFGYEPSLYRI